MGGTVPSDEMSTTANVDSKELDVVRTAIKTQRGVEVDDGISEAAVAVVDARKFSLTDTGGEIREFGDNAEDFGEGFPNSRRLSVVIAKSSHIPNMVGLQGEMVEEIYLKIGS